MGRRRRGEDPETTAALREQLQGLLAMGNVQGVIERHDEARREMPSLAGTLEPLHVLAQRFWLPELARLLEAPPTEPDHA